MSVIEHPTDEELYDYCSDTALSDSTRTIEQHIADCGECRRRVIDAVRQQVRDGQDES